MPLLGVLAMPDWVKSILEGVFGNLLAELVLALGISALIALIKTKKEKWAGPVLYGLTGFVLVFVLGSALTGNAPLSTKPQLITSENLEPNLRTWLDNFHLSVTKREDPNSFFSFDVVLRGGQGLTLSRHKNLDKYLALAAGVTPGEDITDKYNHLTDDQRTEIAEDLNVELGRARLSFAFNLPKQIVIESFIPITPNLTEYDVIKTIGDFDGSILLVRSSMAVNLRRVGGPGLLKK
jgi:hypothetical protein